MPVDFMNYHVVLRTLPFNSVRMYTCNGPADGRTSILQLAKAKLLKAYSRTFLYITLAMAPSSSKL